MIRPKQPRIALSQHKYRQLCEYVFNRDGCCVFCGRYDQSTPAHIKRRGQGGHDAPNNLVRACIDCHSLFDRYLLDLPRPVQEMLDREPESL